MFCPYTQAENRNNMMKTTNKDDFYQQVYKIISLIPKGKVTTYGHIARALGNISKARTVGYAMHSVIDSSIPCHRVVNKSGKLAQGYVFG